MGNTTARKRFARLFRPQLFESDKTSDTIDIVERASGNTDRSIAQVGAPDTGTCADRDSDPDLSPKSSFDDVYNSGDPAMATYRVALSKRARAKPLEQRLGDLELSEESDGNYTLALEGKEGRDCVSQNRLESLGKWEEALL